MLKIAEWSYRTIYMEESKDYILKVNKEYRTKKYFWIEISFNQRIYTLLKFWISDFNEHEIEILNRVKDIIPENIPELSEITPYWLIQSIIKDYNWDVSKNLKDFDYTKTDSLKREIKSLFKQLINEWIEPMDIWKNNIIIQEYSRWKYKPILFDFKRVGWRTYPFQPWLFFSKKLRQQKVYRKLDRVLKN